MLSGSHLATMASDPYWSVALQRARRRLDPLPLGLSPLGTPVCTLPVMVHRLWATERRAHSIASLDGNGRPAAGWVWRWRWSADGGREGGLRFLNRTAFGILQATRTRISRTEYISCPSCGRTCLILQETTARIRAVTDHLKGHQNRHHGLHRQRAWRNGRCRLWVRGTGPGKSPSTRRKKSWSATFRKDEGPVDAAHQR